MTDSGRKRVLISAYACGPGDGSEPGAGWMFSAAAAQNYEVWVLTRRRFAGAIAAELRSNPALSRYMHVIYLDLPDVLLALKRRHADTYWYYPAWQALAKSKARELAEDLQFDLVHHVTFASDWMPCGMAGAIPGIPFIWGPVGGSTRTPHALYPWLGPQGVAAELIRTACTSALRAMTTRRTASRAALILALNSDVKKRFEGSAPIIVEPNAALGPGALPTCPGVSTPGGRRRALFVGRLVSWKGTRLALAAMDLDGMDNWELHFIGSGSDEDWLQRHVRRLGLEHRVILRGQLAREKVLAEMAGADAMLFPSMHDSAPWAVAEAAAAGLPVVCLNVGGPPELAISTSHAVAPTRSCVQTLANELQRTITLPRPAPTTRWSRNRLPSLVDQWYESVLQAEPRPATSATNPSLR
ncbi:hypothetical protein GCM10027403_03300 [Arthrobacter tecti]